MVVGAFPAAKLGALLLKQVSKPLAAAVKSRAKNSPFFRTYICMPPAQFYHFCEVRLKMWTMNLGRPVNIPKLNEQMAIELGAELLGEGIIFIIAAGVLVVEFIRSSRKEAAREKERVEELVRVQSDLKDLYTEKARQEAEIRELIRLLKIKLPETTFNPKPYDVDSIPKHHRDEEEAQTGGGIFSAVTGWFYQAIDVLVPEETENQGQQQKQHIIVIQQKPSQQLPNTSNCESVPSTPNATQNQNNVNAGANKDSPVSPKS